MIQKFHKSIILFLFLSNMGMSQSPPQIHTSAFGADSIGGQHIQMQYYYLHANSVEELQKEIEAERAKAPQDNEFMGRTRTRIKWNWEGYGKADCDLKTLNLSYEISIRFPRWQMPNSLPEADKKRWIDFIKNLAIHELGHVKVVLEEVPKMEKRIREATCLTAEGNAQAAMIEFEQAQLRYDDATYHGLLQGAKF